MNLTYELVILAAFAWAAATWGGNASKVARVNRGWECRETTLGRVPEAESVVGQPLLDEHGWNYGVVVQTPTGRSLWLNGKSGPVFEDLVDARIMDAGLVFLHAFSPDGRHLAYAIRQSGRMRMVRDDRLDEAEEEVDRPTFSPDGRHLAYAVKRKGQAYVLLDGMAGPAGDDVCG